MNEELDGQDVAAAVAGYPRTGRDLADGYLLAALVIRATYDPNDPEIERALRLYTGDVDRLLDLATGLAAVRVYIHQERDCRAQAEYLAGARSADAAATVLMPALTEEDHEAQRELAERAGWRYRVPGEVTQEIRIPVSAVGGVAGRGCPYWRDGDCSCVDTCLGPRRNEPLQT